MDMWRKRDEFQEFIVKIKETREIDNVYVKNFHYKSSMFDILRRVSHTSQGKFALLVLFIFTSLAILGALAMMMDPPSALNTHTLFLRNPDYPNYSLPDFDYDTAVLQAPSWDFFFGTDFAGRDVFSRLIFGTSVTYYIAIVGASLSVMFMITFGLSSAIYGGAWDAFVTRLSDVLLTFPWVVWLIIISTFSGPLRVSIPGGFYFAVYLGMSFVTWPFGARLLRSEIVETLQSEYIAAITLVGASKLWIIRRHVLSKIVPTIILLFAYQMSDIIIGISLLGYIGYPSESAIVWGSELSTAIQAPDLGSEWWTIVFPAVFIVVLVLALSLFSDAIRDIYEAKFRGGSAGTLFSSIGGKK
jgi:peptide/nickel transport system permease protein